MVQNSPVGRLHDPILEVSSLFNGILNRLVAIVSISAESTVLIFSANFSARFFSDESCFFSSRTVTAALRSTIRCFSISSSIFSSYCSLSKIIIHRVPFEPIRRGLGPPYYRAEIFKIPSFVLYRPLFPYYHVNEILSILIYLN